MDERQLQNSLKHLIEQLKLRPQQDVALYSEYEALWLSLGLNQIQVKLWLASLPLKNTQNEQPNTYQVTFDITMHLVSLLQQSGGRMPLALVLRKLPANITTSEQKIRKLAQQHAQLDIKGPLLILVD